MDEAQSRTMINLFNHCSPSICKVSTEQSEGELYSKYYDSKKNEQKESRYGLLLIDNKNKP